MKVPTIEPLEARIAPAVLTITALDSSKAEGSTVGGTTAFSFKVTLDAAEPQDVTVLATALDGTARIADGDFNAFSQTITIPKGQTEAIFTVPIKQDAVIEADETFSVSLSSPSINAVIGSGSGTASATILNDDFPKVSIVALDTSLAEGSLTNDLTNFRFDVVLDQVATADVTVLVNLKDGTAKVADNDLVAFSEMLVTIPAGQLKAPTPVSIQVKQDLLDESNEAFSVELSSPSANAVLGTAVATATIQDDDPLSLRIEDAVVLEGAFGDTPKLQFKVKLSTAVSDPVTFKWFTALGSAAGTDFTTVAPTDAIIPAGATEITLEVSIAGDNVSEIDENLFVHLSDAKLGATTVLLADSQATGTIRNDDLVVNLSGPATITEGTSDTSTANYTLSLGSVASHPVTVVMELVNGTAVAGSDFTVPTSLVVTIPAGATSANFSVPIKVDNVFEADESFTVRVKSVNDAVASASAEAGVVTSILNDDIAETLTITSRDISEGDQSGQTTLTVSLSKAVAGDVTFRWSTVDGTAVGGQDFTTVTNQLVTIPAGQTSVTLTITKLGDKVYEKDEAFTVVLSDVTGAVVSASEGVGTVKLLNDEAEPTLSIGDAQVFEGDGTNPRLGFVVSITNGVTSDLPIQFNWSAGFGTATPGVDYQVVTPNPVTLPAGATSVTLFIDLLDDAVNEIDETLIAKISNAALTDGNGIVISKSQATGTILNDDLAITLTALTPSASEGNTGTSVVTYRVSIPSESTHDVAVVVQFDAENSTAQLGTDFEFPPDTTVIIRAGQTSVDFNVTVKGDTVFEADEVITLKLADPVNAKIGAGSASLTVTNDDSAPHLFIEDRSITEGANGIVHMTFTVRLTQPASEDVTFDWSTVDGTALGGSDFSRVISKPGKILKGDTSATITVALSGDTLDESDENFKVLLSNAMVGATPIVIDDNEALGTILNDDLTVRISGASLTEGNAGQAFMNFVVSLSQPSTHAVTVTFEVNDGTALAGVDYVAPTTLTATIPAGSASTTIAVPVIGDTRHEADETLTINLTGSTNAKLGASSATGTILNDDALPTLTIADASFDEGDSGSAPGVFTITLSEISDQDVTVRVTPVSGTDVANQKAAILGSDFSGQAQTITIPAGQQTATFSVSIFGDETVENDETFTVELSNSTNAAIADGVAVGTIANDPDSPDAPPTIAIANASLDEAAGTMTFTVTLSKASGFPVTFTAATANGTAVAGQDYAAKTQDFTIPAGQLSATFSVAITNDNIFEGNEDFEVNLSNVVGAEVATAANGKAKGTIIDDETRPTISVGDVIVTEGGNVEVVVTLSAVAASAVTFDWQAINGTAQFGIDFNAVSPTSLTIPAGSTTARINLGTVDDVLDEVDETFEVKIVNPLLSGAPVGTTDDTATVTIRNNDLSLSIADATIVEGDNGDTNIEFTVTLNAASDHDVTVNFATQDGSAISTSTLDYRDFDAVTGTLTFPAGTTTQTISVPVRGDFNFDGTDTFTVLLSNALNARIADGSATGEITDDDDTRPEITITGDVSRLENADVGTTPGVTKFSFTVQLDHASDESVEVSFSTIEGTAKAGLDFTAIANQRVVFAPGETSKTITVDVLNDSVFEADQAFTVELSDALRGTLGADKVRTGTIQADTDEKPTLKITGQTVLEGNNGERTVSFVIQRTGETDENITFQFTTLDGTVIGESATAGSDYVAEDKSITMAPNETSKTVVVSVTPDLTDETDESFSAQITLDANSNVRLADPADGKATTTLLNDDLTVSLQQGVIQVREGNAGEKDLVFTILLSSISTHDTEVTYTVNGVTAGAGSDFEMPSVLTVVIPAGSQTGEIRIPVKGDTTAEPDETLSVTLTGAKHAELGTTNLSATGTILNDDATIFIADGHLVEGTNGSAEMVFTLTLDIASNSPVTVNYTTLGGTATEGTDYTKTTGTVTFAAGETTAFIRVPVLGDTAIEGDETFTVSLSDPVGAQVLDTTATGTIQDDESFLTINDVSIAEGNAGTRTINFTITRSPGSSATATVRVSTLDGTAVSTGSVPDFIAKSEVITFGVNETQKTFSVVVLGDTVFESDTNTFQVVLSDATGALVLDGSGTGTITDSADVAPTIQIGDASITEGDSGTRDMKFVVSLSEAADAPVTFKFTTSLLTGVDAAKDVDFTAIVGQVFTIPAGQKTLEISVPIVGDLDADEVDELFLGTISEATAVGLGGPLEITDAQGVGKILNDDLKVSIVTPVTGLEAAGGKVVARVELKNLANDLVAAKRGLVVTYQITNGTAKAGTDFTLPTIMSVTIDEGDTGADIEVPIIDDAVDEANETFTITILSVTDAKLGDTVATATITDNDAPPTISVADVTAQEGGNAVFTVKLSAASEQDVVVKWMTELVTPGADASDFTHSTTEQTLTIPAGQTTGTISIPITDDATAEVAETFKLRILGTTQNATVPANPATATISANDVGKFTISDVTEAEGTDNTKTLTFTVTRDGSLALPASVNYNTKDITAKATVGSVLGDYIAANGTLNFAANESSKTITISINGDQVSEVDETFEVNLSSPVNATIGDGVAVGKLLNDEIEYKLVFTGNVVEFIEDDGTTQKLATFEVVRSLVAGATGTLAVAGSVFYTTTNNPTAGAILATEGTDYTKKSGTLNFNASDERITITVPITADQIQEGNETFLVKLSSPVNGQLSTTEAEKVVTITDNDQAKIVIENATLAEGVSGTTEMVFKVKLVNSAGNAQAVGGAVVVTYSTVNGSNADIRFNAIAGSDYVAASEQTITFAPGETEKEIRIAINGDATDEADEIFNVRIDSATFQATGASTSSEVLAANIPAPAIGKITNDDLTITIDPLGQGIEGSGSSKYTFKARIPQASQHPVSFTVKTQDGTAKAGAAGDYLALDEVFTIPAGQTEVTFEVTINGDPYAETDETFSLLFSNPANALLAETSRTFTILNDDAAPSLAINDASIVEGDNGLTKLVFTVVLSGATEKDLTFDFATTDGTAKSSGPLVDFLATTGSETFEASPALSRTKIIEIPILGDTWKEVTENFTVKLSNAQYSDKSSVTILDDTGTGEIIDDGDTTLGVIVKDQRVVEGASGAKPNLSFVIETTAPVTGSDLNLIANTRVGSAQASDFTALVNSAVKIPVGQSQTTVNVEVLGDNTYETSEFFFLDITGFSSDAKPVDGSATATTAYGVILNDDVNIINSRKFQYVDTDGDLVTVTFSKGTLRVQTGTTTSDSNHITFNELSAVGGHSIKLINLAQDGFAFTGVNITMVAKPQVLVTGDRLGDSKADVGTLSSAVLNQDLFQISSGANLGSVKIPGNLGQLIAGYTLRPAGVKSLEVGSFGTDANLPSLVLGPIGKLVVNGDFTSNLRVIGDVALLPIPGGGVGKIGTLVIKGDLKGGASDSSGRITYTGGIGSATIGNIVGGAGESSGSLGSFSGEFNTRIGNLTVLGNVAGGNGKTSGVVEADVISSVAIRGSVIGSTGEASGVVFAGSSKQITLGKAGAAIGGDLVGGAGAGSGRIEMLGNLSSFVAYGDIIGGKGSSSGALIVNSTLGSALVKGSILGGSSDESSKTTINNVPTPGLLGSGYIDAAGIGSVTVEGTVKSGQKGSTPLAKSGGIYSTSTINKLNVHSVEGNEVVPVVISAYQSIGNSTFGGNVKFLELLAGYANASLTTPRGEMLNAGASIADVIVKGTFTASSIVAGVYAGADGKFGTADDAQNATGGSGQFTPANQTAISRIANVVLASVGVAPDGVAANASYGIVAEQVKSLKVEGTKIPLLSGPSNDEEPVGPAGSKLQIFEI